MSWLETMNARQHILHGLARHLCIVMGLQVKPALSICAEKCRQTQRSIRCNAAQPVDNLIDATWGYFDGLRQRVLTDAHRLQKVFQQDFAGMRQRNFTGHDHSPSVVIDNLNAPRMAVSPFKTQAPLIVDTDAVLSGAITLQGFQPIIRRYTQKLQRRRGMHLLKLAHCHGGNVRKPGNAPAIE